jgi:hypothetical protein
MRKRKAFEKKPVQRHEAAERRRVTTCDSVRLLKETVWVHWDLLN